MPWARCLACSSYFDSGTYDEEKDVVNAQLADYGQDDSGKQLNQFKRKMYRSVLDLLKHYRPPPATLLDVGCSFGGFLQESQIGGYEVSGVDILPQAIQHVRSMQIPGEVAFSLGEVKMIKDESLDVVTCLDCNCYWSDQSGELHQVFAKLKPGGLLVMRVVDKSWMCSISVAIRNVAPSLSQKLFLESVNDHRFSMPIRSLHRLMRMTGFEVVYTSPRGAVHSDETRPIVKMTFTIGALLWDILGIFVAPGALVVAKKRE